MNTARDKDGNIGSRPRRDATPPPESLDSDERRIRNAFRIVYAILVIVPVLICLLLYAQGTGRGTYACAGTDGDLAGNVARLALNC